MAEHWFFYEADNAVASTEMYGGGIMMDYSIFFYKKNVEKQGWEHLRKTAVECYLEALTKSGICDMAKSDSDYRKFKNGIRQYRDKKNDDPKVSTTIGMFMCIYLVDKNERHHGFPNVKFCGEDCQVDLDLKDELADLKLEEKKEKLEEFKKVFSQAVKTRSKGLIAPEDK